MFKNLTGFANLLKNAGQLTEKAQEVKSNLESQIVEGVSPLGVHVKMNGMGEVQDVMIPPALLSDTPSETLGTEICTAMNIAVKAAKQLHAQAIRDVTGGLGIPGLDGMINQFAS
jgi:DNA-binding YbaB/EbfC family protein